VPQLEYTKNNLQATHQHWCWPRSNARHWGKHFGLKAGNKIMPVLRGQDHNFGFEVILAMIL